MKALWGCAVIGLIRRKPLNYVFDDIQNAFVQKLNWQINLPIIQFNATDNGR